MVSVLAVLACAVLNRMRGDDRWMLFLPGRALYYVAPLVALVAWDWRFGVAFLAWGLSAWGEWFDLGRLPDGEELSVFEKAVNAVSFGSDHLALFIRHALILPVLYWIVGPWALLFPFVVVAAYEVGWRVSPRHPIIVAEVLTGALWGAYAVAF